MTSWHELWRRREAAAGRLLRLDQEVANFVEERDKRAISDLQDPHGKRFLFDDFEGMAQQTILRPQAILAACLVPSLANQARWSRARLRACLPGCACLCARCAYTRERARGRPYAHEPT